MRRVARARLKLTPHWREPSCGPTPHPPLQHMLLNTNPWLLGVTFIVSTLHSIFDFLAFKNGSSSYDIAM